MKDHLLQESFHHKSQNPITIPVPPNSTAPQYELNPTFTHYRLPKQRPTVAQIRKGEEPRTIRRSQSSALKIEAPAQEGEGHTQGTFIGVFAPSLDNILNIVYFVRLPYVISVAGGCATLIGWVVSFFLVLVSVFSLSAMSTNGDIETGGSYYLLSRTIGPEIGGAAGFCLCFASLIGCAQAHLGLMEVIVILYSPKTVFGSEIWDIRIFSSILTVIIGFVTNFGFSIRLVCLFGIWLGILGYFLGLIFPSTTKAKDILSCNTTRFQENWTLTDISISQIFYTFSIIFPGFGGILAGSNSSGQLKRPQVSIPLGSIAALIVGLVIFITTTLTLTGCHPPDQLDNIQSIPIMESSFFTWFVFIAIAATSVAKAITGAGTGPMVLRAMAQDGLISPWFEKHSRVFGTLFSIAFCLYGDFNQVSSLSSMLFLGVFTFLDYGVFMAKSAKVVSWRPHFKFYNPILSLVVCLMCIVSMFLINWVATVLAVFVVSCFYYYLKQKHIDAPWGSLSHSDAYNNGLVAALRLRHVPPHPKLYRPNIAMFIRGQVSDHQLAITFLDQMLQEQGMAVVARIFDPKTNLSDVVKDRTNCSIKTTRNTFHIFYETVVAEDMKGAFFKVMLLTGLASLRPNVVFVEFDEKLKSEITNFVMEVIDKNWPIMIVRRPQFIEDFGTIDCWLLSEDADLALLMGTILAHKGRKLRVLTFANVNNNEKIQDKGLFIRNILKRYRVFAEVIIVPFIDNHQPTYNSQMIWDTSMEGQQPITDPEIIEKTTHYMRIADEIRAHSSSSMITVISLPKSFDQKKGNIAIRWLNLLSSLPHSVLFVRNNGTPALSWQV